MRQWLTDRSSLTAKLIASSEHFRVQCLQQRRALCLQDECRAVGLPGRRMVREREVLLRCDGQPMVFAHTIVPLTANASDWPFFNTLGERSLGTTLFGDPKVLREPLEFARLHERHPLARRAAQAVGMRQCAWSMYARRCLYQRKNGLLLVTEVFLPAILALSPP